VCPPGKNLALLNRRLHLMDCQKHDSAHLPIDYFLRSLAEAENVKVLVAYHEN
jgi:two-component system CheB/CheR fusion protein